MAETQNTTTETEAKKTGKKPEMLVVRGPSTGRWRAGRHFGPAPVEIPLADLKKAEIELIESDPVLSVSRG